MTFLRHCERSEAIHLSMREVTMDCFASLAMTGMGRSEPNTPVCVGYDDPLATRKILKADCAIEVHLCQSRPCERSFSGSN
jgi:hypothetical protein